MASLFSARSLGRAGALVGAATLLASVMARAVADTWDGVPRALGVAGAALAVAGLVVLLAAPAVADPARSTARRAGQVVLPVAVVALVMPATGALAANALTDPSPPGPSAQRVPALAGPSLTTAAVDHTTHGPTSTGGAGPFSPTTVTESRPSLDALEGRLREAIPAVTAVSTTIAGTGAQGEIDAEPHGHATPEQPLDRDTRVALGAELVRARVAAMRHPTVADAEAAGYRMVTPYVKGIGAHYMNFSLVDTRFDVDQPEMLLYDGTDPTSRVVGLSYYVLSGAAEPGGFAGPNDHWHQHIGLCIKGTVVVGGEKLTHEQCAARGGVKSDGFGAWMVHAWIVPGWESPEGVFSPAHPGLT
ncbi:MAG TPA: hypothetical protein VF855_08320 [Acidimicrobiales bacterium]